MLIYKLWLELIDLDKLTRFEIFHCYVIVALITIVDSECYNGFGIVGVNLQAYNTGNY